MSMMELLFNSDTPHFSEERLQDIEEALKTNPGIFNRINLVGFTPMMERAIKGDTNAIRRFHMLGAKINKPGKGMKFTPLHCAVRSSSLETVQVLLDLGASPDEADVSGYTPLVDALVHSKDLKIVELLFRVSVNLAPQNEVCADLVEKAINDRDPATKAVLLQMRDSILCERALQSEVRAVESSQPRSRLKI
jgi:ankyrin repeat protein